MICEGVLGGRCVIRGFEECSSDGGRTVSICLRFEGCLGFDKVSHLWDIGRHESGTREILLWSNLPIIYLNVGIIFTRFNSATN